MNQNNDEQGGSRRWIWVLLGKGAEFVFQGVVTTAVQVGLVWSLLAGLASGFDGDIIRNAAPWGLGMGATMGLLVYGGLYGVIAFANPYTCRELAPRQFYRAVFLGIGIGAIAGGSSLFGFLWLIRKRYLNLDGPSANSLYIYLMLSILLAIFCGSVGGAMWKCGRLKVARK